MVILEEASTFVESVLLSRLRSTSTGDKTELLSLHFQGCQFLQPETNGQNPFQPCA